jgi:hypothetical protein
MVLFLRLAPVSQIYSNVQFNKQWFRLIYFIEILIEINLIAYNSILLNIYKAHNELSATKYCFHFIKCKIKCKNIKLKKIDEGMVLFREISEFKDGMYFLVI